MTALIGTVPPPPKHKLKAFTTDELKEGWEWMALLSRDYKFKPGAIKSRSTQSYTRALTVGCIRALNRHHKREMVVPGGESYDSARQRSSDMLGIIDALILELAPPRNRFVQACGKDWQPHIEKMADYDHINRVRAVLANPSHTLELWGWQQYAGFNKDGTRSQTKFWMPRVQRLSLEFLLSQEPPTFVKFWDA